LVISVNDRNDYKAFKLIVEWFAKGECP
jgi:hypothetical protein